MFKNIDEIISYCKRYYFKRDLTDNKKKLYDSDAKEFIPDGVETTKIKAALAIGQAVFHKEGDTRSYNT